MSSDSHDSLSILFNNHLRFRIAEMPNYFTRLMTYSDYVEIVSELPDGLVEEGAEWVGHKVFHPVEKQHMIRWLHGDKALSWVSMSSSATDIGLPICSVTPYSNFINTRLSFFTEHSIYQISVTDNGRDPRIRPEIDQHEAPPPHQRPCQRPSQIPPASDHT